MIVVTINPSGAAFEGDAVPEVALHDLNGQRVGSIAWEA